MKYITKNDEPQSFKDWKDNDKMYKRGKPNWDRFNHSKYQDIKTELLESLKKEQGYICCYCEVKLQENDYHPEHLKPKSKGRYPELQLEYENLLCSCQLETESGEPRHCGNSKGSWYDKNLLVSPLNTDCELKFKYNYDGTIDHTDKASELTIIHLQLSIDKLNDLRNNAIEPFLIDPITFEEISKEDAKIFADAYLNKNNGQYNEFYTTIKYLFG
jgi:uncharacterized protein (TIGR02646 family)